VFINLFDSALESEMSRVVLEQVDEVISSHEGIIDTDDLDLASLVFN
jgi:hypothetical protein